MSDRPQPSPAFRPAPLNDQADAIIEEYQRADKNLPKYTVPRRGKPTMSSETVRNRIWEYKSIMHSVLVLERFEKEGRLPQDLIDALQNTPKQAS